MSGVVLEKPGAGRTVEPKQSWAAKHPLLFVMLISFVTTLVVTSIPKVITAYQMAHPTQPQIIAGLKQDMSSATGQIMLNLSQQGQEVKNSDDINAVGGGYSYTSRFTSDMDLSGTVRHFVLRGYAVGIGDHAHNYCQYDSGTGKQSCFGKLR